MATVVVQAIAPARVGVLLVNLGTPEAPTWAAVGRYLRTFLGDGRVVDIPAFWRWLLVNLVIVPFRAASSARAYRTVWTDSGSPLLVHGMQLTRGVAAALGPDFRVALGMRYGQPSIAGAVAALYEAGIEELVVLPLFPHYSSAATGSAIASVLQTVARLEHIPAVRIVPPFYQRSAYLRALTAVTREALAGFEADHVLMSYHGLPERQVVRSHRGVVCDRRNPCPPVASTHAACYRAQCYATSRNLASALGLSEDGYGVSFQSRLGRTPWIQPYTDECLRGLRARGVQRLAVLSPAFVADCLETLEELGQRLRDSWLGMGGTDFRLAPCLNSHAVWVEGVTEMIREEVSCTR